MRYDRQNRISMAREGHAIPITNDDGELLDGSLPIADAEDLDAAIGSVKHHPNKKRAQAHIVARAGALGQSSRLPKSWTPKKRPRGRPVGSPSLTKEREDTILRLIRRGAFDATAAGVAGISERTLREWVARGEGRSSRPKTAKLEAFARGYRTAKAEARAIAEVKAFQEHILKWLQHAAASTTESQGWTTLPEGSVGEGAVPMPDQLAELITGIRNDLLYSDRDAVVPPCGNRRCRCAFHRPRTVAEQATLRALGDRLRRDPGSAA